MRAAFGEVRELILRDDPALASSWLERANQGVDAWREGLQIEPVRNDTIQQRQWIELFPEVADGLLQASLAVGSASAQIEEHAALARLHESFAEALREARQVAEHQPPESALLALVSLVQGRTARVTIANPDEQLAVLRELFSRHFPQDDDKVRMQIRTAFRWRRASASLPSSLQSKRGLNRQLPRNEPLERHVIALLRALGTPEDRFLAESISLEPRHWVRSVADASRVMECFWAMRDLLATDGALFEQYLEFFNVVRGQEPDPECKRIYRVRLPEALLPQSTPPMEITDHEFSRLLFIHLIAHAPRSHPGFESLLHFSSYTREQILELQTAIKYYAARTGTSLRSLQPRTRNGLMNVPAETAQPSPDGIRAPTTMPTPASNVTAGALPVTRFILPAQLPRLHLLAGSFHWENDRLWFLASSSAGETHPFKTNWHLFAYTPDGARVERFDLPAGPEPIGNDPQARLTISPTHFIVDAKNAFLAICDRNTMRWAQYPEIKSALTVQSLLDGDALYLVTDQGKAFVRFDLRLRRAEVLASTQRHPSQSPLDQPGLGFNRVWKNRANEIAVAALIDPTNPPLSFVTVAAWSSDTTQWRLVETNQPKTALNQPVRETGALQPAGILFGISRPIPIRDGQGFVQFRPLFPPSSDRAVNNDLYLRIRDQSNAPIELPISFSLPDGLSLVPPRVGITTLPIPIDSGFASPSVWVFPITNGPGFWVLPTREMEAYLAARRARQAGAPR
ncbi:MAG: hypothetical protein IPL39_15000 [Opitutaceae bacterium]|nr:hypothetical protein [Opitutaceae bacterium]